MPEVIFISVCVLGVVSLILIPIYLRNRLQQKQLETIARAIEQGVDLERIRSSIAPERAGDVNGNWKAGVIVTALGLAGMLLSIPQIVDSGFTGDTLGPLLIVVVGAVLLYIHYSIIGRVVRQSRREGEGKIDP